jgi:hypothetical protein
MRLALAFILGAIIAAGTAVLVVKHRNEPTAAAVPAAAPVVAPSQSLAPAPVETAERSTPARKPAPVRSSRPEPSVAQNRPPAIDNTPAPAPQNNPAPAPEPAPVVKNEPAPAPLPPPPPPKREPKTVTIPSGTLITVRLNETLNTDKNQSGDTFTATLDQPLVVDGLVLAERGSRAEGRVVTSEKAGRIKGLSNLQIQLTKLNLSDGQRVNLATGPFEKQGEKSTGQDAAKIGVGAAIGAAIGAIAGGGKGAAIGAGAGGAAGTGTVMATRGKPTELRVETRISFKLNEAVPVTERLH